MQHKKTYVNIQIVTEALQREVTATRAEIREYPERQAIMERRVFEAEHRVKEMKLS